MGTIKNKFWFEAEALDQDEWIISQVIGINLMQWNNKMPNVYVMVTYDLNRCYV